MGRDPNIKSKKNIASILALIVAMGTFGYVFYMQSYGELTAEAGKDGSDGEDFIPDDIYYCSSEEEVQSALNSIGTGSGKIIITQDIILTSQIDINQGGTYIIEGMLLNLIDCGGNNGIFNIVDIKSCTIRNLVFNGTNDDSGKDLIYIEEINNNPVIIQNVHFYGDDESYGIDIRSNDVWVEDCSFYDLKRGINNRFANGTYIINNHFERMSEACAYIAYSKHLSIQGNYAESCYRGFFVFDTNYTTVVGNNLYLIPYVGICLSSGASHCTVSGNTINWDDSITSGDVEGIYITYADCNSITGNSISNIDTGGGGTGYGMYLLYSDYNTVVGNCLENNEYPSITESSCTGNLIANNIEH